MRLVDADKLIKALYISLGVDRAYYGEECDIDFDFVIQMINIQKTVEPKTEWIPVNERLPEKWGDYLVTIKWKGSYSGDVYTETNMAVYDDRAKEWDCTDVIAWMPLPEPDAR